MDYVADPPVDDYIGQLPEWQRAICRQVRDLVHAADPEVAETTKTQRCSGRSSPTTALAAGAS
jgi:hypothetical protein